jgi:hypothetical protein
MIIKMRENLMLFISSFYNVCLCSTVKKRMCHYVMSVIAEKATGHVQHTSQMRLCVLWCSWQMAQLHGHNGSNYNNNGAEQWWNVKRSLEIHTIFDTVFGDEARTRVVRVLATQSGSGTVTDGLEQALIDTTANPGLTGAYDVLAIAPYFGNGATAHFSGRASLPVTNDTVDEILDYTRDGIWVCVNDNNDNSNNNNNNNDNHD